MAKMLMAAALVGGAATALILFLQRHRRSGKKEMFGRKANRALEDGIGRGERLGTAAMG